MLNILFNRTLLPPFPFIGLYRFLNLVPIEINYVEIMDVIKAVFPAQ